MERKYEVVKFHQKRRLNSSEGNIIILFPKIIKSFLIIVIFILFWIEIKNLKRKNNKIHYNNIHLAVNMDDNYLYPCIVYFTSLLTN